MLFELIAIVCAGLFAGAAWYISLVEDRANAFSEADRALLEQCAADAAEFWRSRV